MPLTPLNYPHFDTYAKMIASGTYLWPCSYETANKKLSEELKD